METYFKQYINKDEFNLKVEDDYSNISQFFNYFDINCFKFKKYKELYCIKLNNSNHLKFFQDELTVKYNNKGITTDFAVSF